MVTLVGHLARDTEDAASSTLGSVKDDIPGEKVTPVKTATPVDALGVAEKASSEEDASLVDQMGSHAAYQKKLIMRGGSGRSEDSVAVIVLRKGY